MDLKSLLLIVFLFVFTHFSSQHGHHQHQHHQYHVMHARSPSLGNSTSNSTHSVTFSNGQMLSRAFEAMARLSYAKVSRIDSNLYHLLGGAEIAKKIQKAPSLNYDTRPTENNTALERHKRRQTSNDTLESTLYTIPDEIAEAAKLAAESSPTSQSTSNIPEAAAIAAELHSSLSVGFNDTNVMQQSLLRSNGLLDYAVSSPQKIFNVPQGDAGLPLEKRREVGFWMPTLHSDPLNTTPSDTYQVWRNVKDYGAKGDGLTDHTDAIERAMFDGGRCGEGCDSMTSSAAVIFFPSGTYLVSRTIKHMRNTQIIGDAIERPTIMAAKSFVGFGVITSDILLTRDYHAYLNSSNHFRSVRNLIVDTSNTQHDAFICGIHWQAGHATSLENIDFYMAADPANTQHGLYVQNGIGGSLSELTFVGGYIGLVIGSPHVTASRLGFSRCSIAVALHVDRMMTLHNVIVRACDRGFCQPAYKLSRWFLRF